MAPRTGIVTSENGENTPLPIWPYAETANGHIGKFNGYVRTLLESGAYYSDQNTKVFQAKKAALGRGQDALLATSPLIPTLDARRSEAKRRQAQIAAAKKLVVDDVAKLLHERDTLKPYDPSNNPLWSEMRTMSRAITQQQRQQLLSADPDFRAAVLSAQPWLSGIEPSLHRELWKQALEERYGPRLKELNDAIDAGTRTLEVHSAVAKAIDNELVTVGPPPNRPVETTDVPAVELMRPPT